MRGQGKKKRKKLGGLKQMSLYLPATATDGGFPKKKDPAGAESKKKKKSAKKTGEYFIYKNSER